MSVYNNTKALSKISSVPSTPEKQSYSPEWSLGNASTLEAEAELYSQGEPGLQSEALPGANNQLLDSSCSNDSEINHNIHCSQQMLWCQDN